MNDSQRYTVITASGRLYGVFVDERFDYLGDGYAFFPEVVMYNGTGVASWYGDKFGKAETFRNALALGLRFVMNQEDIQDDTLPTFDEHGLRVLTPSGRLFSMVPHASRYAPEGHRYTAIVVEYRPTGYVSQSQTVRNLISGVTVKDTYVAALNAILTLTGHESGE